MIISASYKTDIPTFYGDWFINRLRGGYCKTLNPYNRQILRVSLRPEDVDGFVFWTKNVGPFLGHLSEVHRLGFPFLQMRRVVGFLIGQRCLVKSFVDSVALVDVWGDAVAGHRPGEVVTNLFEFVGGRICGGVADVGVGVRGDDRDLAGQLGH